MLQKIRTLVGITDPLDILQDPVINLIIENIEGHLTYLLGKPVPLNLQFITLEIAVMRFNRLGAEGMKSELTEGHRTDFFEPKDDFQPYLSIIESEREVTPIEPVRGKVLFI